MDNDILFEHFTTLSTAPDGIARLRELILQLAIQGKLGTQDAGDEPASVLLDMIKKQIGYSENPKKHGKELSEIEPDKIPFDLPNNWIWTQIGSICTSPQYGWTTQGSIIGETYLLRTTDITSGCINWDTVPFCSEEPTDLDKYLISDGDVVVSRAGSVGMSHLITNPKKAVFASYLIRFKPMINREYFALFLKSPFYWSVISEESLGTGVPNVNATKLKNCYFPLPPLAEQHRIVAKVDRLMALCDGLEARQQQERTSCLKLGTTSLAGLQNADSLEEFERQWAQLCDAFDLIMDCPENMAVLRQTILQMAVQGQLVRQEPGDESASVVRKRSKQDEVLTPVRQSEISFSAPSKWKWYHIADICTNIVDCPHTTPIWTDDGYSCVRTSDVKPGKIDFNTSRFVSEDTYVERINRLKPQPGDIIYTREGTLGSAATIPENTELCLGQRLMLMRPAKYVDSDFLTLVLNSPYVLKIVEKFTLGSTAKHINVGDVKKYPIPLPPLAEQHRIVAKVNALMELSDTLEAQLKERAKMQGRFAGAVVKRVATD